MNQTDNTFFEEYKHLDKLCSDMYSCQNGVSEYIAQMENQSYEGQSRIPSWSSDYKMLKHVRWVRNKIAHDSNEEQISNQEDISFVHEYYNRIISGQDSLAQLRKAIDSADKSHKSHKSQQDYPDQYTTPNTQSHSYTSSEHNPPGCAVFLIGAGVFIFLLMLSAIS